MVTLVLASTSPWRRQLLERLALPFQVESPGVDESPLRGESPRQLVERLAVEKARAVAERRSDALVIGADQCALHGDRIVGKPRDRDEAVQQLREASGSTVRLLTGLALLHASSGRLQSDVVPFDVTFRVLSPERIEHYLDREDVSGCAGSLRADGLGISLLARLSGDDPNALIGLPLIRLVDMLAAEGIEVPGGNTRIPGE